MTPFGALHTPDKVLALYVLGAWLSTAALGAILLLRGGAYRLLLRRQPNDQRLPLRRTTIMASHVGLAVVGASFWAVSIVTDRPLPLYVACAVLFPTAVSGLAVFSRWLPPGGRHARLGTDGRRVPEIVAVGHLLGALITIIWALMTFFFITY